MKLITNQALKRLKLALLAGAAGLLCGSAIAAPTSDAKALLRQETAVCHAGRSTQDHATCMREAHAAYAQNLRGDLADRDARYRRNALDRCELMSGCERQTCVSRVKRADPPVQGAEAAAAVDVCILPVPLRPELTVAPQKPL